MNERNRPNRTIETKAIAVGEIHIKGKRHRLFRPDHVDRPAASMAEIGLLTPIVVRRKRTGTGYWLVSGWHRLEAARLLDWPAIDASVFKMSDIEAEIAEIEENLRVAYLSPAERMINANAREEAGQ